MNNSFESIPKLFPGFSPEDTRQIGKALEIVEQATSLISESSESFRPKGIDVATILMSAHVDLEAILAALLSDSRLSVHVPRSYYSGTIRPGGGIPG